MGRASNAPTVCLTMIVKNEAHVIRRCLASVKPLIAHWVIVDTGSTDGTQNVIRDFMSGIPGELHERPWKDFAHNRTEAIELARGKADYDLVIDADDVLELPPGYTLPELTADSYLVKIEDRGTGYFRTHFFRGDLDFHYTGVLHEVLMSKTPRAHATLPGVVYRRMYDGARSADPEKFRKDAAVLEAALAKDPKNARYAFYLAQSWRDAGEAQKAAMAYEKRAAMGGWDEEVFASLLERAKLAETMGSPDDAVIGRYLRAFELRPQRAEPLYEIARCLRTRNRPAAAYPFARGACEIPRPGDILFVNESVYTWRAQDELGVSAYWAGRYAEAAIVNERLLAGRDLPDDERPRVEKNLQFCRDKLAGK